MVWIRILLVALLAAGGSIAATWVLGDALTAAVPRDIGPPPAALLAARPVAFASASGSRIGAWVVPGRPGTGAVVLAHAVRSDRRSMVGRARFLQQAGYTVLLFDAQAHGESPGRRITFGYLEAHDVAAAVAFLEEEVAGSPVAYLGVSQGGAAALLGPCALPVSALVLEAVYPTIREAVANRIAIRLGEPGRLLAPLLLWQLQPRLGIEPEAMEPIGRIGTIQAPLLLVAGERDRHTTLAQSRALYHAAPEPKDLWIVPGAAHQDFHRHSPEEYERRVLAFLEATLGAAAE